MTDPQTAQRTESLKEYMDIFKIILDGSLAEWGIAYSIMPAGEEWYWFINRDKFTEFCDRIRRTEPGEKQCRECTFRYSEEAGQARTPISYLCDGGLIDIVGPVIVQGEHVATIACGQRRREDEDGQREGLKKVKRTEGKLGFKHGELVKLWEQVPVMSQEQVEIIEEKLAEVAGYVAKLIEDKKDLEEERAQSAARLRETEVILRTIARLGEVVTVDKFWLRVNKALSGVCEAIGAHFGLVVVSAKGGKVFTVKASSDWREKTLIGESYYADDSPFLHQALRDRTPFAIKLGDYLEDKFCISVLEHLYDVMPTSTIAISFELGGEQVGIMTFFSESQLDTERGGLPFEEEKDILGVIAPQVTTAFQNCQLYTEQRKLERERTRFIQDITHQLTGPLAGIHAHCENLLEGRLSVERGKKVLRSLVEQSRTAARYIRNFASMSSVELGTFSETELDSSKENVTKLLIECARDLQGLAASHGISIHVDEETVDTLPRVAVDKLFFKQAITNILDNAVKYSDDNTAITVSASSDAREARLYFVNYGIPVKKEDVVRIFDRYVRTKEAREKVTVGTGVGLFIAREIIGLHGGSISVEPSIKTIEGNETTFVITLPISRER
jgi:signal transduction histidine kinase/ligand-binding sensor protein